MAVQDKLDYGNWVSRRLIFAPGAFGIVLLLLSYSIPILTVFAIIFLAISLYFAYARYLFAPSGGNVQHKIQRLILEHLDWNGQCEALDIGCGSGCITMALAKKYPEAKVTGIDFWGSSWEYSIKLCEKNANAEKVSKRVYFQQASASKLPFEDEAFDAVISNLTFHEVRDEKDKTKLLKEALRVLKKGGAFVFQDLFLWKAVYGNLDDLLAYIKSLGIEKVEFIDSSKAEFIPTALKLPFMVGTIGILHGRK